MKIGNVYILLIVGTFFWGLNFHLAQIATSFYSPLGASAARYLFATVGMIGIIILFRDRDATKAMWIRSFKNPFAILSVALTGVILFNYFFFKGLVTADPLNGALIIALNPVFTQIFGVFLLKKWMNRRQIAGTLISLLGVTIVITKGDIISLFNLNINTGEIYILISSLLFALHNVLVQKHLPWISPQLLTLFTCTLGFISFSFLSFNEFTEAGYVATDLPFWISSAVMGIFGTSLSFIFWNKGVREIGAGQTALFLNLVPVYTAITGVFFSQSIYLSQILGGVTIAVGIVLSVSRYRVVKV